MTAAEAHLLWDRVGLQPMSEAAALEALERLMVAGAAGRTVARVEWERFKSLRETRAVRPFLKEVGRAPAIASAVTEPAAGLAPDLQASLNGCSPEERLNRLSAHLHRELCSILGLDPSRALDPARGFAQMGLDSLMAIDLRNRLQKALGRSLPSPVVFNYPNIRALAVYLAGSAPAPVASTPEAAPIADRPLAANEITELSDEEAEALLATRVAALGRDGV